MKLSVKHLLLAVVLILFCASLGCSSIKKAYYKDQYISGQMSSYAYTADFNRLWNEARTLLFESGYMVRDSGNGYNVETEWGWIDNNTKRRYLLNGYTNADGTSSIQFNYVEETYNPGSTPYQETGRDYTMEYRLLQRVDYNKWVEVENAADVYANSKVQD